ncbi:MAG: glycosyltransferase [Bacteroidales bacterium]|jgi:glycosyltransferase involved in cell wall biosynthesis|nr:glycosyltransferase [Bacteroidales bacterium]
MLNIFCLGAVSEDYRTKNTLKFFLEKEDYRVFYNDFDKPVSYKESFRPVSIRAKLLKIFSVIPNFFYMLWADIIYVFAMQHGSFPVQIAFFFKKKLVVDFFLSFYDTEVNDYKHIDPDSKKAKRIKKIDRNAIINSRVAFFLNQSEAEYYTKILDLDINAMPYRILPLCIDEKPQARIDYFLGNRDCLNLCWCGSYVPLQGLDVILTAVSMLKGKINLHLYIWGASDKRGEVYKKMVENFRIHDVVTIHNEWGNRKKWEEFIVDNCDISLGIFGQSMKAQTVLANKVLDGIAFRTPVITARSAGLYEYFNGIDDIFITENTPAALAEMIEYAGSQSYSMHKTRIDNAYKKYQENFTPNCFYKKLNLYIREITNNV